MEWAYLDLNLLKYEITGCSNKSNLKPTTFKAYIQAQHIHFKNQPFLILTQNEPYTYLGIHLVPSLKWHIQKNTTMTKAKYQSQLLVASLAKIKQEIHFLNTIIKPSIAYAYYAVSFSKLDIKKLDKILNKLTN